jgi:hypothetical protein
LYFGRSKPSSVDEYLFDLIEELKVLKEIGLVYKDRLVFIDVAMIVADAPARSFIKQCKNHNSYNGCEKCIEKGEWAGRVIFKSVSGNLRTDEGFKLQCDKSHHIGISPFMAIDFPLVSGVPLDYMHLVCLGVVRKLLRCWVKGPIPFKISVSQKQIVSDWLISLRIKCPKDFCREPRSLKELDMWKATEFRTFLLYTGPVVLKEVLTPDKYKHFLLLSVAIRILVSDKAQEKSWNDFSAKLLSNFVSKVPKLYSKELLTYNLHSLIHLSKDALMHGPLDAFSAFPFENNMQVLKRSLRGNFKPLEQCIGRIIERDSVCSFRCLTNNSLVMDCRKNNNCFRLKSGVVVLVTYVDKPNDIIKCRKFLSSNELFYLPIKSSLLGIVCVSRLSDEMIINVSDVLCKCWLMSNLDNPGYVAVALVSSI